MSPLKIRPHEPATFIIVVPQSTRFTPFESRFSRTLKAAQYDPITLLSHGEASLSPKGTSPTALIYNLGHPNKTLSPIALLTPVMLRQLRHALYNCRQTKSNLHIFGMLDNQSPYGTRRCLEPLIRLVRPAGIPTFLHLGLWHPTPREYRRAIGEMKSIQSDTVRIGSLFPVDTVLNPLGAKKYIDGILHPHISNSHIPYPLHYPAIFSDAPATPNDTFLFANHRLHGLSLLEQELAHASLGHIVTLDYDHDASASIQKALDRSHHIIGMATQPAYLESYFGTELTHPYYEQMVQPSSMDLLEMLISPHFGYSKKPYRTVVILDEITHPEYDWLFSSLIKQTRQLPYYCCFLRPNQLEGNILISNIFNNTVLSPSHLHNYD